MEESADEGLEAMQHVQAHAAMGGVPEEDAQLHLRMLFFLLSQVSDFAFVLPISGSVKRLQRL